jgi:hypothetical protein
MSNKKPLLAILVSALAALGASGCSDSPPPNDSPRSDAPRKVAVTDSRAAAADDDQPVAITIKKGEKRNPEAAYIGNPKKGNVSFDFANADLSTIVLPLFSKQAGVTIEYGGTPRKLEKLRLVDEPWRDALCLICKFTLTHARQSQIQGRIELVNGYDDPGPFLARWDPNRKSDEGLGVLGAGGQPVQGASSRGSDGPSGTPPPGAGRGDSANSGPPDPADFKGGNVDRVNEVRNNVTPTNSGAR